MPGFLPSRASNAARSTKESRPFRVCLLICPPTIFDSSMIVFCPGEGELAAILWTNNLERFLDGTAIGEPLNPFC